VLVDVVVPPAVSTVASAEADSEPLLALLDTEVSAFATTTGIALAPRATIPMTSAPPLRITIQ
jgi:hypothetical protein